MKRFVVITSAVVLMSYFSLTPPAMSSEVSPEVIQSLKEKLERWDVETLWPEVKEVISKDPRNPELLELAFYIALHGYESRVSEAHQVSHRDWRGGRKQTRVCLVCGGNVGMSSPPIKRS